MGEHAIVYAQRPVKSWHPWIQDPNEAPAMEVI